MSGNIAAILAKKRAAQQAAPTQPETPQEKKDNAGSQDQKPVQQPQMEQRQEESKPISKPTSLREVLRDYSTIDAARKSPVWKLFSLREKLELGKLYLEQQQLGSGSDSKAPSEAQASPVGVVRTNYKNKEERILATYPDFASFSATEEYQKLSLVEKAQLSREFTKKAQQQAIYGLNAQRELEKAIEIEEKKKALEQRKLEVEAVSKKHEAFNLNIKLNDKQQLGVDYALAGKYFVYTGPAGTGKTTGCREMARAFLRRGGLGLHTFKTESGDKVTSHGIAFISYTRRATSNIRRALHKDPELEKELQNNVVTVHRLLEYEPEFFVTPEGKNSMRFIPKRTAQRPLDVKVIVIEEASMLGLDLWEKLYAAMRPGTIVVFVGDINQLPPVFGKSIMNYALAQLPVIELTEVYRQAFDSGIIVNAHKILKGLPPENNKDTQIVTGNSPTHVGQERMARALGGMFFELWKKGEYDPEQDIILSPWNKQPCGTDNLNAWISQFLGEQRNAMVYEVLAGRRKLYLAVGDRVMYEKRDGVITAIRHNGNYLGKAPQPASTSLTRFGLRKLGSDAGESEDFELAVPGYENINIDEVPDEEKKLQASHNVELLLDDGTKETLSAVGDYAEQVFSLGYCLTVHKAQGCEWRKVYVVLHKDHTLGGFLTRELVYTAVTRAREKLILIAKPDVLAKAVKQQSIKGNTLEEKIQSINSGASNIGTYPVVKR